MKKTQYSRKLDDHNRLVIPKPLRQLLDLRPGEVYDFYLHEENGMQYLAIPVGDSLERAKELLRQAGYAVREPSEAETNAALANDE